MPKGGMKIDGVDLGLQYGFLLSNDLDGWRGGLSYQHPIAMLPGRPDGYYLGEPTTEAGQLVLNGYRDGRTLATVQDFVAVLDRLKARCRRRAVKLEFDDQPDRYYLAKLQSFKVVGDRPALTSLWESARLTFISADPRALANIETTVALAAGVNTAVRVGTERSRPVIVFTGPNNPTIDILDKDLVVVQSMGITYAGSDLTVDCDALSLTSGAGPAGNQNAAAVTGDFVTLDPDDADPDATPFPFVYVKVTGCTSAQLTHRPAFG